MSQSLISAPVASALTITEMARFDLTVDGADTINTFGHRSRGSAYLPAWYPGAVRNFVLDLEAPWTHAAFAVSGAGLDSRVPDAVPADVWACFGEG